MKIQTRQDKLNAVAATWHRDFYETEDAWFLPWHAEVYARLLALPSTPTAAHVREIVGPDYALYAELHCDECQHDVASIIETPLYRYDESDALCLCRSCLLKTIQELQILLETLREAE